MKKLIILSSLLLLCLNMSYAQAILSFDVTIKPDSLKTYHNSNLDVFLTNLLGNNNCLFQDLTVVAYDFIYFETNKRKEPVAIKKESTDFSGAVGACIRQASKGSSYYFQNIKVVGNTLEDESPRDLDFSITITTK